VLDVGCGPGTITADLADRVAPGVVTALEVSREALELARSTITQPNVEFATGDVHALPYADATFDVVHAHQVLQHVADPVAALAEMRRCTRSGGIVAARDSDYRSFAWYPAIPALDDWLDLYQHVARGNGGEPDAGRRLLSWARRAGFTDVTSSASTWCFATAAERQWWGGLWADRIRYSAMADQAIETGAATREDLQRIADAWLVWAASDDGWLAILHGEVLCRV
jgi:ubiquinone/menaquinone biosynthesis C-methylase UbiE